MKKFYGILLCLALMAFKMNLQAQSPCPAVTVEVTALNPQTGQSYWYGVRVRLSQAYSQNVTVSGTIGREGGYEMDGWQLVIIAGNLTAETTTEYYATSPTSTVVAEISSVTPCPPSQDDLSFLMPTSSEIITTGNSLYTNFVNATGILQRYSSLTVTDQNLELFTHTDSYLKSIVISISGVGSANKLIAVCNTQNSEYMYYFMDYSLVENEANASVYNEDNVLIYETIQTQSTYDLNLTAPPPTCFSGCMNAKEEEYESTFRGWVLWNLTKITPLTAAIYCHGCCKRWWTGSGCVV